MYEKEPYYLYKEYTQHNTIAKANTQEKNINRDPHFFNPNPTQPPNLLNPFIQSNGEVCT